MPKLRVLIALSTIILMAIIGTAAILYARGYRINLQEDKLKIGPTGLLVANSEPQAAQVYVNGELATATDNTISLVPDTYDIEIKKEGYQTWKKQITIEKESVTQIDAFLLPNAPSLTALTFSGAVSPQVNQDNTKLAYIVPATLDNIQNQKAGLWMIESSNLPLGFNRDPRQITNGDLIEADYEFSPDSREILLTINNTVYLLDATTYTPLVQARVVTNSQDQIRQEWDIEKSKQREARIASLPDAIESFFAKNADQVRFSPDENRILYTASASAILEENLVAQLPGSSTQVQERTIQEGSSYVYDIREDRNFKVADSGHTLYWLPNSLNLVHPTEEGIRVLDYDGTNELTIFGGGYIFPHAYVTTNSNRLIILTNFGSSGDQNNLYWLSLK